MHFKHDFKTLKTVQKEAKAFQDFAKKDLNEDGKVKNVKQDEAIPEEETESAVEDKIDYLRDLKREKKDIMKPKEQYVYQYKTYNWLMEKLISPSDKISGCEVQIPDMVLLEGGKPKYFVRTDR